MRRIVICGGGIMGCATAFYLSELMSDAEPEAEEGDVSVLVVESSGEVASQASGKAGGFLASDWSTGSLGLLAQKSFELHSELADVLGAKTIGYRRIETFSVRGSSKAKESSASDGWISKGLVKTSMGTEESTAQVHPKMLTKALLERAVANGKTKFLQGTVKRVMLTGSKVCGVQVDDYELPADAVLIALGPWSNHARSWFPKANLPDIYGMRAHSVVVRMPQAPPQALFLPNEMGEVYPRPDGTVYVCGEGDDDALPDDPKDVEFLADKCKKLKDNLETMCPSTKGSEVLNEQACYLPCTSNGAPIIGAIPCYEGAYIATGHTCWGILNGPATGKAMAELIWKGKAECVDLALFQP